MTGAVERELTAILERFFGGLWAFLKRRGLTPRTMAGGIFLGLTIVALLTAGFGALGFGERPDPDYIPYCDGQQMQPADVCDVFDPAGGSGQHSYQEMVTDHNNSARVRAQVMTTMFEAAAPLTAVFGVLTLVAETRGRRRASEPPSRLAPPGNRSSAPPGQPSARPGLSPVPARQGMTTRAEGKELAGDPLARLARQRGWTIGPPHPSMPTGVAELGTPVGTLTGQLDGWPVNVTRYTLWTQFSLTLPVKDLPWVKITVNQADGQLQYARDAVFGQKLMTPQVHEAIRRTGITKFSVNGIVLSLGQQGQLPAADIEDILRRLSVLAAALPVDVLRHHGKPVS